MVDQSNVTRLSGAPNVADILERVLDKGIVIAGDVKVSLAHVEILTLQIRLVICSIDKAAEIGMNWWTNNPAFAPGSGKMFIPEPMTGMEERVARLEESPANR